MKEDTKDEAMKENTKDIAMEEDACEEENAHEVVEDSNLSREETTKLRLESMKQNSMKCTKNYMTKIGMVGALSSCKLSTMSMLVGFGPTLG